MQPQPLLPHQAVGRLYGAHHGWLRAWLQRKLGCTEQAADLAQDTFVRLLARPRNLDALHEPRAYLTTIAHGLVVNHWRRQDIERAWLTALAALPQPLAPSPEERQQLLETLREIDRVLDGLSARVREIFLLSQLDGLSYPQIAAQLGVSVNLVQKAMLRALAHCYRVLYA